MNIILYFAVNSSGEFMYLTERFESTPEKNQANLLDILDDINNLNEELNWSKVHKPTKPGIYKATIKQQTIAEDDFILWVVNCKSEYIINMYYKKGDTKWN